MGPPSAGDHGHAGPSNIYTKKCVSVLHTYLFVVSFILVNIILIMSRSI
jgi:hypothetical protein